MATFGEIKSLVKTAIGRDDSDANTVVEAAINYALLMGALTFEPPELFKESAITLPGGSNKLHFPNLPTEVDFNETDFIGYFEIDGSGDLMPIDGQTLNTNLLDIIKVYNTTNGFKLGFIPFEQWDSIIPSSLLTVKYWTMFGDTMYININAPANLSLMVHYTTYPKIMMNDAEELPYAHHDQYIVSSATGIAFAAFEEIDSADLWNKISSFVGNPAALGTRARAIIEGQRVMLESAIAQAKGGAE